jgi:hypothetical protein
VEAAFPEREASDFPEPARSARSRKFAHGINHGAN